MSTDNLCLASATYWLSPVNMTLQPILEVMLKLYLIFGGYHCTSPLMAQTGVNYQNVVLETHIVAGTNTVAVFSMRSPGSGVSPWLSPLELTGSSNCLPVNANRVTSTPEHTSISLTQVFYYSAQKDILCAHFLH